MTQPHAASTPHIEPFDPGPYATNCYLLWTENDAWIVDAGFEPQGMIERARALPAPPSMLILTHAHVDHIAGVEAVRRAFPGITVAIHEAERDWLTDAALNLSAYSGTPVACRAPDRLLRHAESLTLGASTWRVIHTPGHSPGGITLHEPSLGVALVGDALFAGSIGRTDFPGCSMEQLSRSIRERLYTLPDATRVLPGHGPETTIGREARSNPFVRR